MVSAETLRAGFLVLVHIPFHSCHELCDGITPEQLRFLDEFLEECEAVRPPVTMSAAVGKKQACPCLSALGAELIRLNEENKKAKEDKNKAREQVEHEKEGEKGKEKGGEGGKGQEGEEGKGQQGEGGKGQQGEEQTAAAPAAERAGQDEAGKEQTAAAPAAEGAAITITGRDRHAVCFTESARHEPLGATFRRERQQFLHMRWSQHLNR